MCQPAVSKGYAGSRLMERGGQGGVILTEAGDLFDAPSGDPVRRQAGWPGVSLSVAGVF